MNHAIDSRDVSISTCSNKFDVALLAVGCRITVYRSTSTLTTAVSDCH